MEPSVRPDQARGLEREGGANPDDVALAGPRALLYLPRLAVRALVLPLRAGLVWAGRHTAAESGPDDPDDRAVALWPELSHQSWLGPTLGLHAAYRNLAGRDEQLAIAARFLGEVTWSGGMSFFGDAIAGAPLWTSTTTLLEQRGQNVFAGIGDRPGPLTRYRERRALVSVAGGPSFGNASRRTRIGVVGLVINRKFSSAADEDDPSIEERYNLEELDGFTEGTRLFEGRAVLQVDTRNGSARPTDGTLLNIFAGGASPRSGDAYAHLGADWTSTFDLFQGSRLLNLRLHWEAVVPRASAIPFSELPRLGGPQSLRGYPLDWLRDRSAALAELEYDYPVHAIVDGVVFAQIGRVGHDIHALFDDQPWHPSAGFGLRVRSRDKSFFSLDVAYGNGLAFYLTTVPGGGAP